MTFHLSSLSQIYCRSLCPKSPHSSGCWKKSSAQCSAGKSVYIHHKGLHDLFHSIKHFGAQASVLFDIMPEFIHVICQIKTNTALVLILKVPRDTKSTELRFNSKADIIQSCLPGFMAFLCGGGVLKTSEKSSFLACDCYWYSAQRNC